VALSQSVEEGLELVIEIATTSDDTARPARFEDHHFKLGKQVERRVDQRREP
jgi:hypothetical protein